MRRVTEDFGPGPAHEPSPVIIARGATAGMGPTGGRGGKGARGAKGTGTAKTNRPLRRVPPAWRRRALRAGLLAGLAVLAAGGGVWLWQSEIGAQLVATGRMEVLRLSERAGFGLKDIRVLGRVHTTPEHILAALEIHRNESLFLLDVDRAKMRLEALPWVRSAVVERRLPDTIRLIIAERRAVALFQRDGAFVLLDPDGAEIVDGIEGYRHLPIVVGDKAPRQIGGLLALIRAEPSLAPRVKAAQLIAGRRWNLRLDAIEGGIDIRLPEDNPAEALRRLVDFDRQHGLLQRRLVMVDMRMPDRLVVRVDGTDKDQVLPVIGNGPGRDA